MENLKAEHLGSGREAKHWPKATLPEYAFIGRSNVGKSSLINMLVGIHRLARVSNTPGRTRNVEHFRVEAYKGKGQAWMLADLPGYGFAKASKDERALWEVMIRTYLRERESLQCVFVLVDVRIAPQQSDLDMIQWLGGGKHSFRDRLHQKRQAETAVHRKQHRAVQAGVEEELGDVAAPHHHLFGERKRPR
jgi:GTP-binding protein